ncbi:MAG: hypothetical protein LBP76_12805 [Treponema sp.]|jgi:hypothetical protein|nr:hypothetical protein [Treponema sp.]
MIHTYFFKRFVFTFAVFLACLPVFADDEFDDFSDFSDFENFDSDAGSPSSPAAVAVSISGDISGGLMGFIDDFKTLDTFKGTNLSDIFSGNLNFAVKGGRADAVINLALSPVFDGSSSPIQIDEAYLRAYFGPINLEAGLRKITWGKADSLGPLDVVNPLDYSDLSALSDIFSMKIARPMLHAVWNITDTAKLEVVFEPGFRGHKFSLTDRWAPAEITALPGAILAFTDAKLSPLIDNFPNFDGPAYTTLMGRLQSGLNMDAVAKNYNAASSFLNMEYAQAGLRFTATLGGAVDLGLQYFYGNLFRPMVDLRGLYGIDNTVLLAALNKGDHSALYPVVHYNRYHQIGLDYAQVLAGFNLRSEIAVNITEDLSGDDNAVTNPFIAWSLGFDRDLVWGINLNLQATETIRLLHDKVSAEPFLYGEEDKDITATRLTVILSKKILRDELELKTTGICDIEDKGFYIIPAIVWTRDDIQAELSAGVFGGDDSGELGGYWKNSFIKTVLTFSF